MCVCVRAPPIATAGQVTLVFVRPERLELPLQVAAALFRCMQSLLQPIYLVERAPLRARVELHHLRLHAKLERVSDLPEVADADASRADHAHCPSG